MFVGLVHDTKACQFNDLNAGGEVEERYLVLCIVDGPDDLGCCTFICKFNIWQVCVC